ncbi:MAG: STAS domain-containing protein [Gammaproteobacteria bacterium]
MSVTSSKNNNGAVTINIGEQFTFESHHEFRDAYRDQPRNTNYVINLSKTTYMDSSALGMLLLLREFNGENNTIQITSCNEEISKIFEIARFDKMFLIE